MLQRILLIVLIATALVAPPAFALSPLPEEAVLRNLLDEFLAGATRNDADVHDRFWADDLVYTRSAGVRIDKAELMKGVRSAPAPKPEDPKSVFSAEDVRIRVYGDAAVVAFKLVGTTTPAEGGASEVAYFLNTGTFIRRAGEWQAVAWQSTKVPPAADTGAAK